MTFQAAKEFVVTSDQQEYVVRAPEDTLKRLVASIRGQTSQSSVKLLRRTSEAVDEIILETDIDGTHYYLVRSTPLAATSVSLSPRELAIARLIAKGLPNKCIGEILDISPWTVATHLRRIFIKLGVTSRAAMVAQLGGESLLEEDENHPER